MLLEAESLSHTDTRPLSGNQEKGNMNRENEILSFRNLDLAYGNRMVLKGVDFSIGKGEFWFFLGPNGMGKTTLLRAILGEVRPRSGEIALGSSAAESASMGFIPQHCELNPTLPTTVREFASLGLTGLRTTAEERSERLSWALEKVGLQGLEKAAYRTLSGGQRQRALVARALVRRPSLLILDEPTKGIDLATEIGFLQFLSSLNSEENLTVIFVAHDLNMAARHGTHAALFANGSILAGEIKKVLTAKNLADAYGVPIHVVHDASGSAGIHIAEYRS